MTEMFTAEIRMFTTNWKGEASKSAEWTKAFEAKTKAAAKAAASKFMKGNAGLIEGCKVETFETERFIYINVSEA
jgi:hypothetical protein